MDEFWFGIHAECFWRAAVNGLHVDLISEVNAGDRAVDDASQAFPGFFFHDREDLHGFARNVRVELEIKTPHATCFLSDY